MDGLLLRFINNDDETGSHRFLFSKLFRPILRDLDRLAWCFPDQPWMGSPPEFYDDETSTIAFDRPPGNPVQLWSPGTLSRFADRFCEEFIELWGIEPTRDDPARLAALYSAAPWGKERDVVRLYAQAWLLYTTGTCWEVYARKSCLLDRVREKLAGKPWVRVFDSHADRRGEAFRAAGLSCLW